MSTPFINPYETKDVVATSLNNLDKQSQDIISYLDGLFSSETVKDKQLILDDGTVETLKPFQVANSQGAFWDKGTTYYFQPVADRLREISLEIQGRLNPTDVSASLKAGITSLFSQTLDDSRSQVSNDGKLPPLQDASDWTYEKWYTETILSATNPIRYTAADIDAFFNEVGTAAFKMVDAASDEIISTKAIDSSSALNISVNLEGVAKLLDDGDDYYNDDNTFDNPSTTTVIEGADSNKQPEFYLIGNKKLPVFGAVENAPDPSALKADLTPKYPGGVINADYLKDLKNYPYNYQNKRIDPNSIYWNNPATPREPEEVFYNMVAIAITQQKVGGYGSSAPDDVRTINNATAEKALTSLKNIAGSYFTDSIAWYDSPLPRNLNPNATPKPPAFLLSKSTNGTIDYSTYDGSYGAFKATDPGTLAQLIFQATGIPVGDVNNTITNWNTLPPGNANVEKITKYYTQSYISSSITSSFGKKDAALSTKNFLIHEALNNLDPLQNPYLEEAGDTDVVKFDSLLAEVAPSGYLRSSEDPTNTHMSNQMTQLMDLFLENFDIKTNRYVEDKRTLVDLFSGKLLKTAGENAEVQKSLFQNINSATKDLSSQVKNTLTRGIPNPAESQFTLDLFNQTAVRKEDYGLSPIPAALADLDPSKHFLPSSWANNKDKFLPAMYYYNPLNLNPSGDEANNTLNDITIAKNGLPAGFPIMDVRDFDQFFKATKLALTNHIKTSLDLAGTSFINSNELAGLYNEMGAFLTDTTITTTYPNWVDAGFAANPTDIPASATNIFGTLDLSTSDGKTNFSRAIQLYKSLDKIIDNMGDRVSTVGQSVPKIPRPAASIVTPIDPITLLPLPAVTLNLQSSITGYGDLPSPKLVKSFLEMHEDTKAVSADLNADSLNRISYLINTFDDYSKFSQNSAFEGIYAGQVFEADKQNFANLNAKKPEPGPDGSIPEDKSIPKPAMAALSSSVLITKVGQVLVNKVNDLVQENDVIGINAVNRSGPGVNVGNITSTQLSGSKESQTYLTNILKQISSFSGGDLSVDVSSVGALISTGIETAMQTLITSTDDPAFPPNSNPYRMVFIDDKTIYELINLRTTLDGFSPTGTLLTLKQKLNDPDLNLNQLEIDAYSDVKGPGYLNYNTLTPTQRTFIDEIRDGRFLISGNTYSFDGGITNHTVPPNVPVNTAIPDNILNTLNELANNIRTMLNASLTEQPPRTVNVAADPILSEINNAKLNFTALTALPGNVNYNTILDADVYEAGPPASTVTMASLLAGTPADILKANATILARKNLLDGLLQSSNKEVGPVLISNLNDNNTSNPYRNLFAPDPTAYSTLDPDNAAYADFPTTPACKFPSTLNQINSASNFQGFLTNTMNFLANLNTKLNNAIDPLIEKPPRNITPANDPILSLNALAQLDLNALKNPSSSVWTDLTEPLDDDERTIIKNKLIDSDVGLSPLTSLPLADQADIKAAREELLEFFLEGQPITDAAGLPYPANYTLTGIKNHIRYKDLITPITTYTYPADVDVTLGGVTASEASLNLNSTVDNSKADSFTLREILGCDKNFTDGDAPFRDINGNILDPNNDYGFPNSLSDLEFKMKNVNFPNEFSPANKKLYVRKMQHFNVLFNTLSGGTTKNAPLAGFTPPVLFAGSKNLNQHIESLANDPSIITSGPFQNIVTKLRDLEPLAEDINALEVSLAGEIKKPKAGPESEIYSTIHLLTQIENQTNSTPANYEAGILQLLNQRKIKDDTKATPIIDLEHRSVADIKPQDGLYQYSGYAANQQYLDPANPLSISGPNIAPATTGNQGWNLQALLTTKGIATTDLPPFLTLTKARDFLVALNEVYKDMQASKSPVIKEQLKGFDLWLRNNSFSPISDAALGGKDSLEADINILDHITQGAAAVGGTDPINTFLSDSKIAAANNKKLLEDLDDIRTASKGFGQRIDDGSTASELRNYFQENIFYPSANPFPKALPGDTRVDPTKDFFGRTLDNRNLPVFGVNIFGRDPNSGILYTVPPDIQTYYANANSLNPYTAPIVPPAPAIPGTISSNSYKNFGLTGGPNLENPYQKIMENVNTLLTALTAAETATPPRPKEQSLYKMMIKNLLGEDGGVPDATLIAQALSENSSSLVPSNPSLANATMGLTYANNGPSTNLKTKILAERRTIGDSINPAKYTGTPTATDLANFALSSKADQTTSMRSIGVEGKSIQELAILLYVMQMFEQSNWDFEKYLNDTSRYEMEAAVE
jgi:hypothetical protein